MAWMRTITAAATMCFAGQVCAATPFGEFEGWQVAGDSNSCGMSRVYEGAGATELTIFRFQDGRVAALVTNAEWSAKEDDPYDISFVANGSVHGTLAHGSLDGDRLGFVAALDNAFLIDLAKGRTLHIFLGEQLIDRLALDGSAAALKLVDACLASRSLQQGQPIDSGSSLPRDPFAGTAQH